MYFNDEYEKKHATDEGTTMGQEEYGTGGEYSVIDDDRLSLAEIIVQYAERATQADGKVNKLESRLAALEMGPPPDTNTDGILCTKNGIWNDSMRTTPTYFRSDPTSIPETE